MSNQRYSPEFRDEAVRQIIEADNFKGWDSINYRINDGMLDSKHGAIAIFVGDARNRAPFTSDQTIQTLAGAPVSISLPYRDIDGPRPNVINVLRPPEHGELTGAGDDQTYAPADEFTGMDSFVWRVNDGIAVSNSATILIEVAPDEVK